MSSKGRLASSGASDREALVAHVLLGCTTHLTPQHRVLVIDDMDDHVAPALLARGIPTTRWCRLCVEDRQGSAWPPQGAPHDVALLRLPRAKDVLEFTLHAAASSLKPGGELLVCGANDEGIKSVVRHMEPLFSPVSPRDARKHCRVFRGERHADAPLRAPLEAWRERIDAPLDALSDREWVHYPGVFARGGLDEATRMLLEALPTPQPGEHILDFASGGGVISAALLQREPGAKLTMLDADAVSMRAARENVPEADAILSDAWRQVPRTARFHHIVSNPPIHRGKSEDFSALVALTRQAPQHLEPGGALYMVVQRQIPAADLFQSWREAEIIKEDNRFRVWRATPHTTH